MNTAFRITIVCATVGSSFASFRGDHLFLWPHTMWRSTPCCFQGYCRSKKRNGTSMHI